MATARGGKATEMQERINHYSYRLLAEHVRAYAAHRCPASTEPGTSAKKVHRLGSAPAAEKCVSTPSRSAS